MTTLKVTMINDQPAVILPPEVVAHFQASDGDEIRLIQTPTGAILQRVDDETAQQIEVAAKIMDEDGETLRRLAE